MTTTKRVMDALARVEAERQAQSPYERLVMDHAYGYTVQHEEFVRDLGAVRIAERRATVERIHTRVTAAYMDGTARADAFPLATVYAILEEEAAR